MSRGRQSPLKSVGSPTLNTAPVYEFRCLYTHDLRQKKKRWHDGFLRFHSFNKRIMVYDVLRNYVGDTHWREKNDVQEGDEVDLDRGGLAQVGDAVDQVEHDLTALFVNKRLTRCVKNKKDLAEPSKADTTSRNPPAATIRTQPKSLNEVLGNFSGAYDKIPLPRLLSSKTQHRKLEQVDAKERSPKRQRLDALFSTLKPHMEYQDEGSFLQPAILTTRSSVSGSKSASSLQATTTSFLDEPSELSGRDLHMASNNTKYLGAQEKLIGVTLPVTPRRNVSGCPQSKGQSIEACHRSYLDSRMKRRGAELSGDQYQRPANPIRIAPTKGRKKLICRDICLSPKLNPSNFSSSSSEDAPRSDPVQALVDIDDPSGSVNLGSMNKVSDTYSKHKKGIGDEIWIAPHFVSNTGSCKRNDLDSAIKPCTACPTAAKSNITSLHSFQDTKVSPYAPPPNLGPCCLPMRGTSHSPSIAHSCYPSVPEHSAESSTSNDIPKAFHAPVALSEPTQIRPHIYCGLPIDIKDPRMGPWSREAFDLFGVNCKFKK